MSERLDDPTVRIKEKFPSEIPDRSIHVLVQVRREFLYNQPKPRDSSNEWLAEFFNHKVEPRSLPFVGNLSSFVTQPLPAKIRVKQEWLNEWALSPGLQEKMFVLDDDAPCMEFTSLIFNKRTLNPFRRGKTENAFISMWDSIFRNVLDVLFTQAHIDRDSCNGSSTRQKRPDFLFVLDQVCVFRGEEKPPDVNISVPTEELCSKLVWAYGSVPYVFGYAASGYDIQLHALYPLDPLKVLTKNIGTFNLEVKEHLFQIVLVMLNLSLLFQAIADECPASGRDEFRDITRSSGVVVRLSPTFVEKIFPDISTFGHLELVYGHLKRASVPNVDRLTNLHFQKRLAVFKPRGTMVRPSNLLDLFGALKDVLQALVALHRLGWIHRDIRWSNVIRQRTGNSWFLIDFVDAATDPQQYPSGQHLSVEEHAPEIFVENGVHTTAVDIWAVGFLIETSGVEWLDFAGRTSLYRRLIAKDPAARPNAEEVLAELMALEESAKSEKEACENSRRSETQCRKRKLPDS
eukprot:jgi/Phyca11/547387/estExt2_Genewise1Plus.C_PHYCAscaffold_240409